MPFRWREQALDLLRLVFGHGCPRSPIGDAARSKMAQILTPDKTTLIRYNAVTKETVPRFEIWIRGLSR